MAGVIEAIEIACKQAEDAQNAFEKISTRLLGSEEDQKSVWIDIECSPSICIGEAGREECQAAYAKGNVSPAYVLLTLAEFRMLIAWGNEVLAE